MKTKGIQFTKKLLDALKRYYKNQRNSKKRKWDKKADLDNISKSLPRSAKGFSACAGTMWISWKSGIMTVHSPHNYWTGKIYSKLVDGKWVQVSKTMY